MLQLYVVLSANAGLMELCAKEHSQLKLSLALSFTRCPPCRAKAVVLCSAQTVPLTSLGAPWMRLSTGVSVAMLAKVSFA